MSKIKVKMDFFTKHYNTTNPTNKNVRLTGLAFEDYGSVRALIDSKDPQILVTHFGNPDWIPTQKINAQGLSNKAPERLGFSPDTVISIEPGSSLTSCFLKTASKKGKITTYNIPLEAEEVREALKNAGAKNLPKIRKNQQASSAPEKTFAAKFLSLNF